MTCNIFYEDWQIQCCGQPFKVGELVHWTGERDESDIKEYHIDFCEDHHHHHSLHIEGKVSRILSVTSEEDATKHNYSFDEADYIFTDLQEADGWESEKESTDEIYYIFWGYVVTLDDVKITEEAPHRLTMLPDIDQIFMNEDGGILARCGWKIVSLRFRLITIKSRNTVSAGYIAGCRTDCGTIVHRW